MKFSAVNPDPSYGLCEESHFGFTVPGCGHLLVVSGL